MSISQDKNVCVVDLKAYHKKLKKCNKCVWEYECRGPVPHDINCPHGFKYEKDPPDGDYYDYQGYSHSSSSKLF